MKVGTDGVLLGAWAAVRPQDRRMLDIGTGTGLIALMLAQRAPEAHVTGVDIDDVGQARENAAASPWSGRGSRGISWTTSSISAVPGSTATPTTGSGLDSSPGRW